MHPLASRVAPLPPGLNPPDALWDAVIAGYAAPPRGYHTVDHVVATLVQWRDGVWKHPRESFLALLYHDVVYEAGRKDNEERSADVAALAIETWLPYLGVDVARVTDWIRLTARHGSLRPGDVDPETAALLDCDLAILGAEPEIYAAYATGVRQEYLQILSAAAYREGRLAFVERLLASPRLFLSDDAHARLDAAARRNLAAEEARLAAHDRLESLVFAVYHEVLGALDLGAGRSADEVLLDLQPDLHRIVAAACEPALRALVAGRVLDELFGLGPLQPLVADPAVEAIAVDGAAITFTRHALITPAEQSFRDPAHARRTLAGLTGPAVRAGTARRDPDGVVRGVASDARIEVDEHPPSLRWRRPPRGGSPALCARAHGSGD